MSLESHSYDRAYFDGDSRQGYYPPGYQNFPSNYTIANKILELKPKSFLELGGCRGYISHILESQGVDSTNVDIAPHCWHTRACKKFVLADATDKLPFSDKQFDLIFSKDFLEHIPEDKIDNLIRETIRVSKRCLHLVTFSGHPNAQDDKTHKCLKDREWWIEKFNKLQSIQNLSIAWAERGMENAEILKELHNIEKNIPLPLFGSKHWSRKVEYPWAIINSDLKKEDKILNAGSGTDVLGFYLSKFGSVVNLDNNPEVIDEGTKLATQADIQNLEIKLGDICSIPYEDNYFDKVFCISVLEHMDSTSRTKGLEELLRVLKPGGILLLTLDVGETFISEEELPGLLSIFPKYIIPQKSNNILTAYIPRNDKIRDMVELSVLCIKYIKPIEEQSSNQISEPYQYIIEDKEIYERSPVTIPQAPIGENLVKLNIGPFICMTHYGWQNIDKLDLSQFANQNGYIFKQHDVANGIPYPNNSVDIIIASHFLEHLDKEEGNKFLKDCLRVLKIGGLIRLTVPDTDLIVKKYTSRLISEYKDVNIGVEKAQLENDDAQSLYELLLAGHKSLYDIDNISNLLNKVGFDKIKEMEFGKSNSKAIETQTIDMYPTLSLYVEAIKSKDNPQYELQNKQLSDKSDNKTKPIINEPIIKYGITTSDRDKLNKDKLIIGLISTPFFTIPPKGYSGLEQVIWDLACALDELGHTVTIFGPQGSQPTKHGQLIETGPSINTVGVNWYEEERKRYNIYKDLITPEKFDIIHDHSWFAFPYLLKINNPKINIIKTHHGGFNWDSLPNIKPNLVAISKFMATYTENYFKQKGYNIRSEFVYNGIDLDKYPYQQVKTEHLLFVGRLSTFKQPHIAVEIARKTDHKLDIIGGTFVDNDQYVIQLDKMIENDPNISIFKDAPHSIKIEKMKDAKALLFPSRMNEPFGLCALESMSCGTPVIALNDGAISEVVIHNKTGFICNNVQEMIDAVSKIHTIRPQDCRARAEQLSRKVMAENYLNLYRKVIRGEEW